MGAPSCPISLSRGLPRASRAKIVRVCRFAVLHLSALRRRSGESYAEHGCEVACVLRECSDDMALLSAAMLNDVLVHPEGERLLAESPLTEDERSLVRTMHSLRRLHIDANTRDLDTVIDAFTADARILPLRMAHRLNDVRHLKRFAHPLRRQITHETLHMYAPIAGRLGMHAWRHEMEERCFRFLQPRLAGQIADLYRARKPLDDACIRHGTRFLLRTFKEHGIACRIDGRIKSLYSTYRKMIIKRRRFGELTDRLALRIVAGSVDDCYRALGIVHASMHPIPGKLKDYIGAPKENGYRSIHTVVHPLPGVTEQPMEIQIRTEEMHRECEFGMANHGDYKHSLYTLHTGPARVQLLRNLRNLREEAHSPRQFEEALRTYFDERHIGIFDARNTLHHCKKPVSALDAVCLMHGWRARYLKAVKVNGRERALDIPLNDGDTVEVLFGKTVTLRREWIHVCRHPSSRKILREALRRSMVTATAV